MEKQLAQLKPGEAGVITKLRGTGNIKHRLIDMGLVPGTMVRVMKFAPLGDPIEIKVKIFDLALRVSEAETIDVETKQEV